MIVTVVDIETTGFDTYADDILEVAYMQTDTRTMDVIRHGVLYFYKPEFRVESRAQQVHGLTREFLKRYESEFDDNLVSLYTLLERGCIIGKNSNKFDVPFLVSWLQRMAPVLNRVKLFGMCDMQEIIAPHFREYVAKNTGVMPSARRTGKLEEYLSMFGYSKEGLVKSFTELYGDERAHAHSALFDVYMTYICMREARDRKWLVI